MDEDDKRFKQLLDAFNQRVNDIRRKKAKEEADNLKAKHAIMEELKSLIAGEENIGTAFQRFTELQETWKQIGQVPQQAYRDLQNDYSHLRDEFSTISGSTRNCATMRPAQEHRTQASAHKRCGEFVPKGQHKGTGAWCEGVPGKVAPSRSRCKGGMEKHCVTVSPPLPA